MVVTAKQILTANQNSVQAMVYANQNVLQVISMEAIRTHVFAWLAMIVILKSAQVINVYLIAQRILLQACMEMGVFVLKQVNVKLGIAPEIYVL